MVTELPGRSLLITLVRSPLTLLLFRVISYSVLGSCLPPPTSREDNGHDKSPGLVSLYFGNRMTSTNWYLSLLESVSNDNSNKYNLSSTCYVQALC